MILQKEFFIRDVLEVAPELMAKILVRKLENGQHISGIITEVEAYRGEEDLACHAAKGRTKRTEIMYHEGGHIYMYLIYGMYWMLNIVCAEKNNPQAILIRGIDIASGPGRLTRKLQLDKSFYGEKIYQSERLWVEDRGKTIPYLTSARIGIDYAGEIWANKPWRWTIDK